MSLLHRVGFALGAFGLLVASYAGCNEVKQEDLITKSAKIYEAGNKAQKAGNYQEAIATFSQLITTDPEEAVLVDNNKEDYYYYTWALYARGKAKMDSGATDDAIRDFSYLIQWQPSNVDALIQRGMAYRSKKLLDIALRDFSDAIRARPDDKLAYLQRAIVHLELKNYDNAISDGMQAIRLQPQNAEAYRVRGEACLAREDYPHAIDNLEICLAQGGPPEKIKALLSKARDEQQKELLTANQRAEARKLADKAPQLDPNFIPIPGPNAPPELHAKPLIPDPPVDDKEIEALVKSGDEFSKNMDYRGAVKAYTEAILKAPQRADLYEKRAASLLAYNFADRAQGDIETAIRLDGNTPERSRLRAWILLGVHDSYTSVEIANNLIRQNGDDAEAYAIRGTAYLDRKLLDEAIRDLSYAIELSPPLLDRVRSTLAEAYYLRSQARRYAERWKESLADKDRAEELGWVIEREPKPTNKPAENQKQTLIWL